MVISLYFDENAFSYIIFIYKCVKTFFNKQLSKNKFHFDCLLCFPGKKINRVACGSAHSLAWSTNKPVSAGKLPSGVPMEYNHLKSVGITALRNRLVLLHHFSDLFCPSISMFDLRDSPHDGPDTFPGLDKLRGIIVSAAKVFPGIITITYSNLLWPVVVSVLFCNTFKMHILLTHFLIVWENKKIFYLVRFHPICSLSKLYYLLLYPIFPVFSRKQHSERLSRQPWCETSSMGQCSSLTVSR